MKTVNVHEAKTHFSKLIRLVAAGEEVVIAKSGEPVARLVPVSGPAPRRQPGALRGRIHIGEDFDAPDPELEALFESSRLFPDPVKRGGR